MGDQLPTPGYIRQIHLELVAVLAIICVVLALYGWSLKPQPGGFPPVPENMTITVTNPAVHSVIEDLNRTSGNGARLILSQPIVQNSAQANAPWTVEIDHLGTGHVCTPRSYVYNGSASYAYTLHPTHITHPPGASTAPGELPMLTDVQGTGYLYVWLCWSTLAPVSLNGAYLSAQFTPVYSYPDQPRVTRVLDPGAGETADYAIQSTRQPTSSTTQAWVWSSAFSATDPIRFTAVDTSATQHDSYRAFLSGIVFGIAGGALVTVITELLAPLSRRRERRLAG